MGLITRWKMVKIYNPAADCVNELNDTIYNCPVEEIANRFFNCMRDERLLQLVDSEFYSGCEVVQVVQSLFEAALKRLPPEKIQGFLNQACTERPLSIAAMDSVYRSRITIALQTLAYRYEEEFDESMRLRIFSQLESSGFLKKVFTNNNAAAYIATFYVKTFDGMDSDIVIPLLKTSAAFQAMKTNEDFKPNLIYLNAAHMIKAFA